MEREAGGRGCPGSGREVSIHRGVTTMQDAEIGWSNSLGKGLEIDAGGGESVSLWNRPLGNRVVSSWKPLQGQEPWSLFYPQHCLETVSALKKLLKNEELGIKV